MGVSQYSLLEVPLELNEEKGSSNIESSLWKRCIVSRRSSRDVIWCKRPKRILMKRRRLVASRRLGNGVVNRVRTLKRLIPNSETVETLDVLFRETADYILSLQMRVRVMQIMVKVLSGSEE